MPHGRSFGPELSTSTTPNHQAVARHPAATRAQSTRPTIRPETPSALAGGGEGERSGSNLDAPEAPFAVLLGRPQRATFTASTCRTEPAASRILGTALRGDVDAAVLRSGSDPACVDGGRESAVACAGVIWCDPGLVRECSGTCRRSPVVVRSAHGSYRRVAGIHRARSGSDTDCVDGRRERFVG
jgi:hypothetical protein